MIAAPLQLLHWTILMRLLSLSPRIVMALIKCPECGQQVSTAAKACPACGFPVAENASPPAPATTDELLAEVRPSWWRYFWLLLFGWLLVPLFIAWIKRRAVVLRVYRGRVTLTRGILSKRERELFMSDIRSIDIDQTFLGRVANIGDFTISTAATEDADEHVEGVPNPQKIRDLIVAQRQRQ
jgi:membrane protein YdbS with pleckstrin-like domain